MKKLVFFLILILSTIQSFSQTQIGVGNQTNTFSGMIRGYHFTAPTNFTICGLEVPNTASNGLQTVRVVRFNAAAPPAFPANTNNFIQLFSATNQPNGIIPCNIPVTRCLYQSGKSKPHSSRWCDFTYDAFRSCRCK